MPVLMGSGIKRPFDSIGDGTMSVTGSEEFVDVSQHPDEHLEEISPSRAMSREDDREDFPEDPPREEPAREGSFAVMPPYRLVRPRLGRLQKPGPGRGGEVPAVAALLKGGEVLTEPSGFCTCSHTSLHFLPAGPGRCGPATAEFKATSELGRTGAVMVPALCSPGVVPVETAMPDPCRDSEESYPLEQGMHSIGRAKG